MSQEKSLNRHTSSSKGSSTSDEEGMIREDNAADDSDGPTPSRITANGSRHHKEKAASTARAHRADGDDGPIDEEADEDRTEVEEGAVDSNERRDHRSRRSSDNLRSDSSLARSSPYAAIFTEQQHNANPSPIKRWGYSADDSVSCQPLSARSSRSGDLYVPGASQRYRASPERDRDWNRDRPPSVLPRFQMSRSLDERPSSIRLPHRGGGSYRPTASSSRPKSAAFRVPAGDDWPVRPRGKDREVRECNFGFSDNRRSLSPVAARPGRDRWNDSRPTEADFDAPPLCFSEGPRSALFASHSYKDEPDRKSSRSWPTASSSTGSNRRGRWNDFADRECEKSIGAPDVWRPPLREDDGRLYGRGSGSMDSYPYPAERMSDEVAYRARIPTQTDLHSYFALNAPGRGSSTTLPERRRSVMGDISAVEPTSPTAVYADGLGKSNFKGQRTSRNPPFDPPPSDFGWATRGKRDSAEGSVLSFHKAQLASSPRTGDEGGQVTGKNALFGNIEKPKEAPEAPFVHISPALEASVPSSVDNHHVTVSTPNERNVNDSNGPIAQTDSAMKVPQGFASHESLLPSEDSIAVDKYAMQEANQILNDGVRAENIAPLQHLEAPITQEATTSIVPSVEGSNPYPKVLAGQFQEWVRLTSASAAPILPAEAQMQEPIPKGLEGRVTSNAEPRIAGVEIDEGETQAQSVIDCPDPEALSTKGFATANAVSADRKHKSMLTVETSEASSRTIAMGVVTAGTEVIVKVEDIAIGGALSMEKDEHAVLPPSPPPLKSQAELDEAKRATVRRRLLLGKQPDGDEVIIELLAANRVMADKTTWSVMESVVYGPPQELSANIFSDVDPVKTDQVQTNLMRSIKERNIRLFEKKERLRRQYRTLNYDWKAHCNRLDRAAEAREKARQSAARSSTPNNGNEETTQAPTQLLPTPSTMSGRASTRRGQPGGSLGFGDAVRSEAEFLEILASLESADMQDPEARAARTATTVPDQEINADGDEVLKYQVDECNGFVADPMAFYLDEFDSDYWSPEEKAIFARKYALWPKQFGKIATALPNKTATQCVHYYYLTKHQPGHDYKAITAARNRNQKRKTRTMKPKKGRGSALMADLKSAKGDKVVAAGEEDESLPASPVNGRLLLASTSADAAMTPLIEEEEADKGASPGGSATPSVSKKRRQQGAVEEMPLDNVSAVQSKTGSGRGGKRIKGQGKSKAGAVAQPSGVLTITGQSVRAEEFPSPPVDSPAALGTPTADNSADSDLAAAEALGALSGGLSSAITASALDTVGKGAKKRKVSYPVEAAVVSKSSEEGCVTPFGPQQRKSRQTTSSYWSIQERADFLRGVAANGKDWEAVATNLVAKSAAQARNYFARNAEIPEFVEAAAFGAQNVEQPANVRERMATEWVKQRLGLSASFGTAAGEQPASGTSSARPGVSPFVSKEPSQEPDLSPPRRSGGMGILSLLNDEPPPETQPRRKFAKQGWYSSGESPVTPQSRDDPLISSSQISVSTSTAVLPPGLPPSSDRISARSSEGDSTDSEGFAFDPYRRPSASQAAQPLRSLEPRPYLPEARSWSSSQPPPLRHSDYLTGHSSSAPPQPIPLLSSAEDSGATSNTAGGSEAHAFRQAPYGTEYTSSSRFSHSPIFANSSSIRNQLSPLLPSVSTTRTASSRPGSSSYERSQRSMPPPHSSAAPSTSFYHGSWSQSPAAAVLAPPHLLSADREYSTLAEPRSEYERRGQGFASGSECGGPPSRVSPYSSSDTKTSASPVRSGPPHYRRGSSPAGGHRALDYPLHMHHQTQSQLLSRPGSSYSGLPCDAVRSATSPFLPRPSSAGGISAAAAAVPPPPLPKLQPPSLLHGHPQYQLQHPVSESCYSRGRTPTYESDDHRRQ